MDWTKIWFHLIYFDGVWKVTGCLVSFPYTYCNEDWITESIGQKKIFGYVKGSLTQSKTKIDWTNFQWGSEGFPSQSSSIVESVSRLWHHHVECYISSRSWPDKYTSICYIKPKLGAGQQKIILPMYNRHPSNFLMWYTPHWARNKMASISQTTLSNSFSWMKMTIFRLKFHLSLSLSFHLTIFQLWFR